MSRATRTDTLFETPSKYRTATRASRLDIRKKQKAKSKLGAIGYHSATQIRRSPNAIPTGGSADYHLLFDLDIMRRESQRLDRDNPIFSGIMNRAADNILGNGFTLQARTEDRATNVEIERLWAEFSEDPEVRGLFGFWELERIALRSIWIDGDCGAIKSNRDKGKLQFIEAERITHTISRLKKGQSRPGIIDGIEVDDVGRPIRFHVAEFSDFGQVQRQNTKPIDASDFVFIGNQTRASQTRGAPVMVSNFPMFERLDDVLDSEATAWQMQSRLALISNFDTAPDLFNQLSERSDERERDVPPDVTDRTVELESAIWFQGREGEKIEAMRREIPGSNFSESIKTYVRLLGLPVGMPLELILLDWSNTNYSSARAALEQAFRVFKCWQKKLRNKWHTPIYRWKLQQWIDAKLIPETKGMFLHEFIAPEFPWIDQLKEAMAWGERIDRGLASLTQAVTSLNMDRNEWLVQRALEVTEAIETAKKISQETGADVPWQIFAGLKTTPAPAAPAAEAETGETNSGFKASSDPNKLFDSKGYAA